MGPRLRRGCCATALAAALLAAPGAAGAAKRADLTVAKLSLTPATAAAGTGVSIAETTRNDGPRRARPTTTRYLLSFDRRQDMGDVRLGRRDVTALRPGRGDAARLALRLPALTAAGGHFVLACADAGDAVRERSERDNCRAAALTVLLPIPPVLPASAPLR